MAGTPTLQMLAGETPGRLFEIKPGRTGIGRNPERCAVVLLQPTVSREHAQIVSEPDGCHLTSLGKAGTSVNFRPVRGSHRLRDGDRIQICEYEFLFRSDVVVVNEEGHGLSTILQTREVAVIPSLDVAARDKIAALAEISRSLGETLDPKDILEKSLAALFTIFPRADRGFVLLRDPESGRLVPQAMRQRRGDPEAPRISRRVVEQIMTAGQAVLISDVESQRQLQLTESFDASVRTMMCVPLLDKERTPIGIVQVDAVSHLGAFDKEDLDVLIVVAAQINVALENARLHDRLVAQAMHAAEEQAARRVQKMFLPRMAPTVPGYRFWDLYEPALVVGGDYFGYFPNRVGADGRPRVAVALGDVSGKGMPAALIMARLSAEARVCAATQSRPERFVEQLNDQLCSDDLEGFFVTFLLAELDPATHELEVVRAGHMPPIIRRADGRLETVGGAQRGLPLAVMGGQRYRASKTMLHPGDVIVFYTDGVSEALSPDKDYFGNERLIQTIREASAEPAKLGEALIHAVRDHAAGRSPSDDLTLVCLGRSASVGVGEGEPDSAVQTVSAPGLDDQTHPPIALPEPRARITDG